jgi:putative membrane protein
VNQQTSTKLSTPGLLLAAFVFFLALSGISPHDRLTWWLEVAPAISIAVGLVLTHNKFRFSNFVYVILLVHALVLIIGGHFTYAEVPGFRLFGGRNSFDKIGHFLQGFTPALVGREFFVRRGIINDIGWLKLLLFLGAAGVSALYEIIEWTAAVILGAGAEAFLGTQGYVWDTQSDMLFACIGALTALIVVGGLQRKVIANLGNC